MQKNLLSIEELANPAGALTMARFAIAIAFPFLTYDPKLALAAYLIASATDVLDGAIARRWNHASHTGAVLDGWVDKILHINGAWSMTLHGYMPAWWMWMWFIREIIMWAMVMTITGDFVSGRVLVQHPSIWGRLTAAFLFGAFTTTLLGMEGLAWPLTVITGITGLICGLAYLHRYLEDRKQFD